MVRIYCELLGRNYRGKMDSKADEMLGYCVQGAQRMSSLLDDLLAYMRASSDTDRPVEAVPLEATLGEVLSNLRAAIEETGATVTHDPMPVLEIAAVHAQQLLLNLIGNALKYRGPAPPKVHVGARTEGGASIISVRDNGIGIAPEDHERVFGVFKRLHSASEYSGSGVGLAICRRIVERYGGRIWVESELGKGATFIVSLPRPETQTSSAGPPGEGII